MKLGYKVVRHQGDLGFNHYEKTIGLDRNQATKAQKKSISKKRKGDLIPSCQAKSAKLIEEVELESSEAEVVEIESSCEEDDANDIEIVNEQEIERQKILDSIPNCYQRSKLTLKTPPKHLLPFNSCPKRAVYEFHVKIPENAAEEPSTSRQIPCDPEVEVLHFSKRPRISSNSRLKSWGSQKFCANPWADADDNHSKPRKNRCRKPWRRFKLLRNRKKSKILGRNKELPEEIVIDETFSDDDISMVSSDSSVGTSALKDLLNGPLEVLWKGGTKPLIQPRHARSLRSIFDRIALPRNVQTNSKNQGDPNILRIAFDVYGPRVKFKKSSPCVPGYRVIVTSSEAEIPSWNSVERLAQEFKDKVPILISVVGKASVCFYCYSEVNLPKDLY